MMSAQALGNFEKNLHYILTFDRPKITQLMTTHNECIEYMRESGRQLMNGTSGKVNKTLKHYIVHKRFCPIYISWWFHHQQLWLFNNKDNNSHDPTLFTFFLCFKRETSSARNEILCFSVSALNSRGNDYWMTLTSSFFTHTIWVSDLFFLTGTREAAFVYALSAATISHTIARACTSGDLRLCSCGPIPAQILEPGYRWGGCADNLHYGLIMGSKFSDAPMKMKRAGSHANKLMHLHNAEVGRQVGNMECFYSSLFKTSHCTYYCKCIRVLHTVSAIWPPCPLSPCPGIERRAGDEV